VTRVDRYIATTVAAGALAGLLVIVCLSFVFEFIDEADDVGRGGYTFATAMLVVALSMVQRAYEAFPMATLIGALVSLGGLAARSELVAMRALGFSVGRIARAVVAAGIMLALLAAAVGEWVAPAASRLAQQLQTEAQGGPVGTLGQGIWARDGEYRLRAERVPQADRLDGVRAYRIRDHRLTEVITAPRANYRDGAWRLPEATVTRFRSAGGVELRQVSSLRLGGALTPEALEVVVVEPDTLSGGDLREYVGYLEGNNLDSDRYRLALWVKLATPLATVVMLLLTVPLVFGSQRSTGVGQQVFLGVLIGLAFFLLNRFIGNAALIYGLPPAVSALAPTMVFLAIALFTLRRVR
jgi:lipopolysaccharide export system permease protein